MTRVFFAALLTLLTACGEAQRPIAAADEERAIAMVSERWVEAFRAGDLDELLSLYTDDARIMSQGQQRRIGKAEIRAMFAELLRSDITPAINFEIEELGLLGEDYAWASVLAAIQGAGPESATDAAYFSRTFIVYKKDANGAWRIFRDIDHATPDAMPVPLP